MTKTKTTINLIIVFLILTVYGCSLKSEYDFNEYCSFIAKTEYLFNNPICYDGGIIQQSCCCYEYHNNNLSYRKDYKSKICFMLK